jgi:phosphohistidine phosphatase
LEDFDRPLKERGREAAKLIGRVIASEKLKSVLVVSSPAVRARETTEIMLSSSGVKAKVQFDPQIYEADLAALLEVLRRIDDHRRKVVLVGHNPGMETLVKFLTDEIRVMPTAALAKISLVRSSWQTLKGGEGHLDWLVTPKSISGS